MERWNERTMERWNDYTPLSPRLWRTKDVNAGKKRRNRLYGLAKCDTFQKLTGHDDKIMLIFEYLKQLEQTKQEELEQEPRKVIEGYRKEKRSKKS